MFQNLSDISCSILKGVGAKVEEKLAQSGIFSLEDLLFFLPLRYYDKTRITPMCDLQNGAYAVVEGVVQKARVQFGKKPSLLCEVMDQSLESVTMRLFHFSVTQRKQLTEGSVVRMFGLTRRWQRQWQMIHPEYRIVNLDDPPVVSRYLTAVYPQVKGLSQDALQKLITQALLYLEVGTIAEWVSGEYLSEFRLPSLKEALFTLHQPNPDISVDKLNDPNHPARQRLAFEELIAQRLTLRQVRRDKADQHAEALAIDSNEITLFKKSLSFHLTTAQERVIQEILSDLKRQAPMRRLLQGDVGSGKTIIAVMAALLVLKAGKQVVVMAPTEILAEQLHQQFQAYLARYNVAYLVGSLKQKQRTPLLADLASGDCRIVIGTHALFQSDVHYRDLGLVIIDEQHRFGVKQRLALQEKGESENASPHQLVMTATPIPRSLAMTAYADLELSIIDELPPGRKTIKTVAIDNKRRLEIVNRIQEICQSGRQVYWVCTLIEDSEALQCQAATQTATELAQQLPDLTIGLVHGQMKSEEKEQVMRAFKENQIQLLIATTVIEVGVNVPNATLMIIENAERLGLAQLHQLRGRVGRGADQSYCVLFYQTPLNEVAQQRLQIMRDTNDGFKIAEADLKIRGPGDFLGTQQTGITTFRIACLIAHRALLPKVRKVCEQIEKTYPERINYLVNRWYQKAVDYIKA